MLGLSRAEWRRMWTMSLALIVIFAACVALYGAFGKADVLTIPAGIMALLGLMAGCVAFMARRPPVVCVSVMTIPLAVAIGGVLGVMITQLY